MFPGKRGLLAAVIAVWAAVAGLVLSPYWASWRLLAAVRAGDAEAVLARLDLTAIRADLRARLAADAAGDPATARHPGVAAIATKVQDAVVDMLVSETAIRTALAQVRADTLPVYDTTTDYRDAQAFTVTLTRPGARPLIVHWRRDPWPWRVVALEGATAP